MIDTYILLLGIVFFGGYRVYKAFNEKTQITQSQNLKFSQKQEVQDSKIEKRKPEPAYPLQTHNIKYWLYNPFYSLRTYGLIGLYNNLVVKNLWINEPFHTKFYEILMVLDKNEFMIIDSNSKVITMNVRGKDNKVTTSKSFQVFATRDIVEITLKRSICDIIRFYKHDAQNIIIAICILILEQSLHYRSNEASKTIIKSLLRDYVHTEDIQYIIALLKRKDEKLKFVYDAFQIAFETTQTSAYNDSEIPKPIQLPIKLPKKFLKEI